MENTAFCCLPAESRFIKLDLTENSVSEKARAPAPAGYGARTPRAAPRVRDHRVPGHQDRKKYDQDCYTLLGRWRGQRGTPGSGRQPHFPVDTMATPGR